MRPNWSSPWARAGATSPSRTRWTTSGATPRVWSSPLGLILKAGEGGFDPNKGAIKLTVNGEVKQDADLADLIWPVADIIAYLSTLWEIQPGDLIYTGTPAGVGAVVEGDEMVVTIDGLSPLTIKVGPKAA